MRSIYELPSLLLARRGVVVLEPSERCDECGCAHEPLRDQETCQAYVPCGDRSFYPHKGDHGHACKLVDGHTGPHEADKEPGCVP